MNGSVAPWIVALLSALFWHAPEVDLPMAATQPTVWTYFIVVSIEDPPDQDDTVHLKSALSASLAPSVDAVGRLNGDVFKADTAASETAALQRCQSLKFCDVMLVTQRRHLAGTGTLFDVQVRMSFGDRTQDLRDLLNTPGDVPCGFPASNPRSWTMCVADTERMQELARRICEHHARHNPNGFRPERCKRGAR